MIRWALVDNPTPTRKPDLPDGCTVVDYSAVSKRGEGRSERLLVRVEGNDALNALRNWANGMPIKHADCTGSFSLVDFTRTSAAWKCDVCGDTWVESYDADDADIFDVPNYRTKREAYDALGEWSDELYYAR